MEKHITHINALSRFLQILDGSFPSGAFVHSFGLEPHIVLEQVQDKNTLRDYFNNLIIDQYQRLEFVHVKKVYKLLQENRLNLIIKEDEKYAAMLNFDYAKASKDMGENYLKHINFDISKEIVKSYFEFVKSNKAVGNELTILSVYTYELDLDCTMFLLLWCKKSLINIASASLKISRIKPTEIQQLLFEFDEVLENYINDSSKRISNFNPLFEEVIFQHTNLEPKLFMT
ncbi:urease accessory protein UreF [Sulfurospirillum arcachonense]|uniref:urease accessory protein UreF n=1 Tax=Sulfurospirillum arcachonense TaxID=57666 RepID=UPI00046AFEAD|nr:urease accessory UreF family protein [Sulfurospirillum arcachonense]